MRAVLIFWGFPIVFFWGWYFISLNDMHFGLFFLSHAFHVHLFGIYGSILHMDPQDVPAALAWLFFVDTLIVVGLALIGKYRRFWWPPLVKVVKSAVLSVKGLVFAAGDKSEPVVHDLNQSEVGQVHPAE